jgi:glycosyltransferase involved in cell wall biosynthesis
MMTGMERTWFLSRNIPESKLVVIPNGVSDTAFSRVDATNTLKKFRVESEKYILFVGRLHKEKRLEHLLNAYASLNTDVKLVIAGPDAGELTNLVTLSKKLGIQNKIVFTGEITEKEKFDLYSSCIFCVLPSLFEAFGIVILEGWAQGKPTIAARVGGIPYLIVDGKTGYLFDTVTELKSKMEYLLENPNVAKTMGSTGRNHVWQNFRWCKVVDKIELLYQTVLR